MIKIENLCFNFGEKKIFDNFSLEIKDGERIHLSAASGKGKTTLLRLILGLEKPTSGKITLPENCRFSCVFQENRLLPHHTALDNVTLFGSREKALYLFDKLGITASKNKYPSALSGGMKRRVAIARALSLDADIYIFDEAFAGLDAALKEKCAALIDEICKDKTVIIVSHEEIDLKLLKAKTVNLF